MDALKEQLVSRSESDLEHNANIEKPPCFAWSDTTYWPIWKGNKPPTRAVSASRSPRRASNSPVTENVSEKKDTFKGRERSAVLGSKVKRHVEKTYRRKNLNPLSYPPNAKDFVPASAGGGFGLLYSRVLGQQIKINELFNAVQDEQFFMYGKFGSDVLLMRTEENGGAECFLFYFGTMVCWFPPSWNKFDMQNFVYDILAKVDIFTVQWTTSPTVVPPRVGPEKGGYFKFSTPKTRETAPVPGKPGPRKGRPRYPFSENVILEENVEQDDMRWMYTEDQAKMTIHKDVVCLHSKNVFERLAFAYAFAQSNILAKLESSIDTTIARSQYVPMNLASTGQTKLTSTEIGKEIGNLFMQRYYINLHTDILDTPEVFWEYDEFEFQYNECRDYLDMTRRVEVLNERLNIMKELYDMLLQELNVQHANKLEIIIIVLICLEVVMQAAQMLLSFKM